ncbi:SDR family NAD(P)-dependent oxidoreductase [Iodobacter ciconiae]|uniref:SDR family NAD(P)-dependent oxidoreductase n=1 Tax=Iodobacter ciconiae TaxID=2496266 RepID=A0A3S8ZVY8_9NEIS|nr:SDR family NAD(P)-dependent oxidoreductase [Iodobacter ciconiae]AZN37585.1 SDR family NAD(P)-dependent oxidoreductase [Iodobacter ciconiae]
MFASLNPQIRQWRSQRVWLIGASSGIGAALARDLIGKGARVAISSRSESRLLQVAAASEQVQIIPFDVADAAAWPGAFQQIQNAWGGVDLVVFCAADYRPERSWEVKAAQVERTLAVNLASVYFGLETILPDLLARQAGSVAVIASVAGYMGLPNASVYGPSKAALINLAELLYADLHPRGLGVYLINPGFVKTELTAKNNFSMPALQTPEQAASAILQGMEQGRFEIHFPRRFTLAMKCLQKLPYRWRFSLLQRLA